jgi:hypothetical protein
MSTTTVPVETANPVPSDNQSSLEIRTLDHTGDTKLIFDRNNPDELASARRTFDDLKAKGFMAYKAEGKDGTKGELLTRFDPTAERIIMAPRVVGG